MNSKGPFICNAVFRGQLVLCLEGWDKDGAFWEHCHDKCLHKKGKDGTCHFEWQENLHYAELSSTKQKDPKRVKTYATSPAEQPLLPASRAEHNNLQALAPSMRNDRGVSWIAGARCSVDIDMRFAWDSRYTAQNGFKSFRTSHWCLQNKKNAKYVNMHSLKYSRKTFSIQSLHVLFKRVWKNSTTPVAFTNIHLKFPSIFKHTKLPHNFQSPHFLASALRCICKTASLATSRATWLRWASAAWRPAIGERSGCCFFFQISRR